MNSSNGTLVCFVRGTLIETDRGAIPIEDLTQGQLILTRDHGYQPLRWIGSMRLGHAEVAVSPHLRPIRIRAGALGDGLPLADLMVSPQHRVLVKSRIAERMFGADEVLIAAKHLTGLQGIYVAQDLEQVEYWHLLFDDHQIILSNGAATESLYTGPEALKSVSEAARKEIFALFPELRDLDYHALPGMARPSVPGRRARNFVQRVVANRHSAGATLQ